MPRALDCVSSVSLHILGSFFFQQLPSCCQHARAIGAVRGIFICPGILHTGRQNRIECGERATKKKVDAVWNDYSSILVSKLLKGIRFVLLSPTSSER